ncbi:MAG: hypothetical protein AAFQ82_24930, partial [Myxococcota bacterium]
LNGNAWILLTAAWVPWALRNRTEWPRAAMGCWLGLPALFAVAVWEPVWDHYFMQYLPVLSLASAAVVERAYGLRPKWVVAVGLVFVFLTLALHPLEPAYIKTLRDAVRGRVGEKIASFNPMVHAVGGTQPACGLVDPMNVFGDFCAASLARDNPLARFRIDDVDYEYCIGRETTVLGDRVLFWFASPKLLTLMNENRERLIFATPVDRARFNALNRSGRPRDRVE